MIGPRILEQAEPQSVEDQMRHLRAHTPYVNDEERMKIIRETAEKGGGLAQE